MIPPEIQSKIDKMCNYLWASGLTNPMDYIEQISYLFFLKMLEEQDNSLVAESKLTNKKYNSIYKNQEKKRWSQWSHLSGKELQKFVRDEVFPFISTISDSDAAEYFKEARLMIDDPVVLKNCIGIIEQINFVNVDNDTKGDMYEYLLSQIKTSGRNGQFRTPRHIIRMITSLVNPKIGERINDSACGTAGFLIGAYEHIKLSNSFLESVTQQNGVPRGRGDKLTPEQWDFLEKSTLFGSDVDRRMIRLAMMNLILHGLSNVDIKKKDAIAIEFYEPEKSYDIILANPPFAGTIDKDRVKPDLRQFGNKTEILFLAEMIDSLRDGGRAGIIVPEGLLFGSTKSHKAIRRILLEKCKIEAVVSLPSGCFQPYSGVKTSVLIFKKGGQTNKVWFYELSADGYTLDVKRAYTGDEGDIPDLLLDKWQGKVVDNIKSWEATTEQIIENDYNLSASRYKPYIPDKTQYVDPHELLTNALKLETEIAKDLRGLQDGLKSALKSSGLNNGLKDGL
jgi:type I restriction enzyme M protein